MEEKSGDKKQEIKPVDKVEQKPKAVPKFDPKLIVQMRELKADGFLPDLR